MTQHTITLHELTLTDNRLLVGDGRLFRARDSAGNLRLHDGEQFRGYCTPWSKGLFQASCWDRGHAPCRFRRTTYTTRKGAERALIREALKMVGAL
jgi:hypothetical protein